MRFPHLPSSSFTFTAPASPKQRLRSEIPRDRGLPCWLYRKKEGTGRSTKFCTERGLYYAEEQITCRPQAAGRAVDNSGFAEPVALTSVFPYLPDMMESFGVDEAKVGEWVGITSGVFSLSQCLTAVIWGRASDKFGRKPTILTGLTCTMIASLLWGMSVNLPMAITARAMAGGCNGNVGIIRTMVAEMVPEKELQPLAFSVMPLVWNLGSIFGPSLGGFFANPAENFSGLFGGNRFLIQFPFALPNIIASGFFLIGISTGILFLKETLETKKHRKDYGRVLGSRLVSFFKSCFRLHKPYNKKPFARRHSAYDESSAALLRPASSADADASKAFSESLASKPTKPPLPQPTLIEVFTRQSVINLVAYTFLALHSAAYDQLLTIFMHHRRQVPDSFNTSLPFKFSGGLGLSSGRIGTIFTMYGICGCFVQFLIFPPVARKFGVLKCFKVCGVVFPMIWFVTPFTALIQNSAWQQLVMFGIMIVKCFVVIFAFPCSVILLTNSAVSLRILGTLNGFAVSISAVGRAIGPAIGGVTFSWGWEKGYMITSWWILGIIAAIGAIPIWFLIEMEGFSKSSEDSSDASDNEDLEEETLPNIAEDRLGEILAGDEALDWDPNEEALSTVDGPPLSQTHSRKSTGGKRYSIEGSSSSGKRVSFDGGTRLSNLERRMSSPIGVRGGIVGPGGGRRLSNGLAASNFGQGTGGTSLTPPA